VTQWNQNPFCNVYQYGPECAEHSDTNFIEEAGEAMSFLFWSLALLMVATATAIVVVPLESAKPLLANPAALIAVCVPLSAVALYALLGSPQAMTAESRQATQNPHENASPDSAETARSYGSVASLVDGLREKLEENSEDAGGWLLLAKSYQHLGRDAEALDAYSHAQALGKTDVTLDASLLGPSLASQTNVTDSGPALRGRASLSRAAAALVQPGDTVFIFAKESTQDRLPVVALRKTVADLPIDFALTDKEMMVPGTHLADFGELFITARVSRSGNASDNSQGLEAWSPPVSPAAGEEINLIIDVASRSAGDSDE